MRDASLLLSWLVALRAIWLSGGACGASQTPAQVGAAKLKQDWKDQAARAAEDARRRNYSPKGGFYHKQVIILEDLLSQAPLAVLESEFQRICELVVPDFSGKDDEMDKNYDHVLMLAFLKRSIALRDTQHLRTLLSHHCPRYVVYSPLEFSLAYEWPGSIEHLFACSLSAEVAGAGKDATFCLGRAFPALRQRFPADHEFVQQAQAWYTANRSKLQVNTMYGYLPSLPPPKPGEDRTNLFIYRPK